MASSTWTVKPRFVLDPESLDLERILPERILLCGAASVTTHWQEHSSPHRVTDDAGEAGWAPNCAAFLRARGGTLLAPGKDMRNHATLVGILALLAFAAAAGCGGSNVAIDPAADGGGTGSGDKGGTSLLGDGGTAAKGDGAAAKGSGAFCSGSGGIVLPGTTDCTGDLAKKLFRFGVCSCSGLTVNGSVKTRSFDSTTSQTLATGGSLGINGAVSMNGNVDIGGSLFTPETATLGGVGMQIAEELHTGKGATANGSLVVGGDYYGSVAPSGSITVKGKSHVPATVAPPCDCTQQVPIAAYVKAFESDNDDAAAGLTPSSFGPGTGDQDVTLACGRYYLTDVQPNGTVTLRLKGRTAIFVAGDFVVNGGLSFVFELNAELDLFVTGSLTVDGSTVLGNVDAPARARIYVAGPNVTANGESRLAANVYAPNAAVGLNGPHVTRGALYAKGVDFNGNFDLEYDEAVLKVQGCQAPAGSCATCGDCSGATPACNGGKCGACKSNADCCAPLQCASNGTCVSVIR
jgi:hypothetical protein